MTEEPNPPGKLARQANQLSYMARRLSQASRELLPRSNSGTLSFPEISHAGALKSLEEVKTTAIHLQDVFFNAQGHLKLNQGKLLASLNWTEDDLELFQGLFQPAVSRLQTIHESKLNIEDFSPQDDRTGTILEHNSDSQEDSLFLLDDINSYKRRRTTMLVKPPTDESEVEFALYMHKGHESTFFSIVNMLGENPNLNLMLVPAERLTDDGVLEIGYPGDTKAQQGLHKPKLISYDKATWLRYRPEGENENHYLFQIGHITVGKVKCALFVTDKKGPGGSPAPSERKTSPRTLRPASTHILG